MYADHNSLQLLIIFSFVIIVVLLKSIARNRRLQMWHETARIALEKGQPLPPLAPDAYLNCSTSGSPRRMLLFGLILVAVGIADYWASPNLGRWGAVPAFIGVALLVYYLIARVSNGPGPQAPPPGDRLP